MIEAAFGIILCAVLYAVFVVVFRGKRCAGDCGACGGNCEFLRGHHDKD